MKKLNIFFLLAILLSACSFSAAQLPFAPTATKLPTSTPTRTTTPSITPTQPTPTFTLTPTLIGYKSPTPTPRDTATPNITVTLTDIFFTATPFLPTPNVKMDGFISIKTSSGEFYRGRGGCQPNSVRFTAQAARSAKASYVVLFVRLASKTSGAKSSWTSITINNDGLDMFSYSLTPDEIKSVDAYSDPWVQYQLVATDVQGKEVGRTGIFDEYLTLFTCVPPTATSTPTSTPTMLQP